MCGITSKSRVRANIYVVCVLMIQIEKKTKKNRLAIGFWFFFIFYYHSAPSNFASLILSSIKAAQYDIEYFARGHIGRQDVFQHPVDCFEHFPHAITVEVVVVDGIALGI